MATVSSNTSATADFLPLWRVSTSKYLQMVNAGVMEPKDRVELIEGVIVEMSPQGSRHNNCLLLLNRLLAPLTERFIVGVQATIAISDGSVFDPDVALLRPNDEYKQRHPRAEDILLIIEAAESSLKRDQQVKLPIYAKARIQEYWIADLEDEALLVYRDPLPSGYGQIQTLRGDEQISPLAAPDFSIAVRKLFE
jgi:Uma2 family endonuclease